jgi:hypothetical protein
LSERRLGILLVGIGFGLAAVVQVLMPLRQPPLYDGVIVTEPYRWLDPPPGHPGGATSAASSLPLEHGKSPILTVYTDDLPPQAQVFASPGALTLSKGATRIEVSIRPVAPLAVPSTGYIDGNVYRFAVVDQSGAALTAPADAQVTVVIRAADPSLPTATIARLDGSAWVPVKTDASGDGTFYAVVTEFGDFAVIARGTSPYPTAAPPAATEPGSPAPGGSPPATAFTSPAANPEDDGADSTSSFAASLVIAGLVAFALVLIVGSWLARRRRRRGDQRPGW